MHEKILLLHFIINAHVYVMRCCDGSGSQFNYNNFQSSVLVRRKKKVF